MKKKHNIIVVNGSQSVESQSQSTGLMSSIKNNVKSRSKKIFESAKLISNSRVCLIHTLAWNLSISTQINHHSSRVEIQSQKQTLHKRFLVTKLVVKPVLVSEARLLSLSLHGGDAFSLNFVIGVSEFVFSTGESILPADAIIENIV